MEIVSKPDIRIRAGQGLSNQTASILRYLGTCDGDMEKGSLRADVNVSCASRAGRSAPLRSRT
jgi:aspartyl-tRNA(Asn)/glutamyl-tRNA(Gln) amidotransferase subunit B